jgi:hypothetical protein
MQTDFIKAVLNTKKVEAYRLVCRRPDGKIGITPLYTTDTIEAVAADIVASGATIIDRITEEKYKQLLNK